MGSFYQVLEDAVLAEGIPRNIWAEFVRALRDPAHGAIRCWTGATTPGRFVLRAWRREWRVNTRRAADLATPLVRTLRTDGPARFRASLAGLACCRAFEAYWQSPPAGISKKATLTTVRTVGELCRYSFDEDPGAAGISPAIYNSILALFRQTNPAEQRKVQALFKRPLGRRKSIPESCRACDPPYVDRLSIVWASGEEEVRKYSDADALRNALGLVRFQAGNDLVAFSYVLPEDTRALIPTSVEAMGGWAFWPARGGAEQRTMDYNTGSRGPREYIHPAEVAPAAMHYRSLGSSKRNWDD